MDYPNGFPEHLQPLVDAAYHDAEVRFIEAKDEQGRNFWEHDAVRDWISSIFFTFADQSCKAAEERIWSGDRTRKALDEFLEHLVRSARISKVSGRDSFFEENAVADLIKEIKDLETWLVLQRKLAEIAKARVAADKNFTRLTPPSTKTVMPAQSETASEIARLRVECRLTQEEVAKLTRFDASTVYRHESGLSVPQKWRIATYERIFGEILKQKIVIPITPRKRK
jgi:hypothetical protein